MYNISKKPIELVICNSFFELQLQNYSYNNEIYSFNFTIKGSNFFIISREDDKEYYKVFEELFPNTHIEPVITANISFDIHEKDIIKSNKLSFKMNKLEKYKIEVTDIQLYKADILSDRDISSIIENENVTSSLLQHPNSKEIIAYLSDPEYTFYNFMPGYGNDVFPEESSEGFDFEEI